MVAAVAEDAGVVADLVMDGGVAEEIGKTGEQTAVDKAAADRPVGSSVDRPVGSSVGWSVGSSVGKM